MYNEEDDLDFPLNFEKNHLTFDEYYNILTELHFLVG